MVINCFSQFYYSDNNFTCMLFIASIFISEQKV